MKKTIALSLLLLQPLAGQASVEEARSVIQEWVSVEKAISQEAAAWREKQQTLETLLLILEREGEEIEKKIESQRKLTTVGDTRREELLTREKSLVGYRKRVETFLAGIEGELRDLRPQLPYPLQEKTEGAFQRIPQNAAQTRLDVAERMQAVVGILAEIQNFNDTITLSQELHELENGTRGEMKTVYLGLGAAYYLMPDGKDAGYGYPTKEGWVWQSRPELVPAIEELLAIYSYSTREARFIPLPVTRISQP